MRLNPPLELRWDVWFWARSLLFYNGQGMLQWGGGGAGYLSRRGVLLTILGGVYPPRWVGVFTPKGFFSPQKVG